MTFNRGRWVHRTLTIGSQELQVIEDSQTWTYLRWWPRLSTQIEQPIRLPPDLRSRQAKRRAIEDLQERLKHIEVVSVVLRFVCPEEFGILSPPVVSLLNMAPAEGEDYVDHFLRYLSVLRDVLGHYQFFSRIADVDMALWSAAHLSRLPKYARLAEEMFKDQYFQEIRLQNMLEGLGEHWGSTDREQLVLGRVMLKHDHLLATLVAARCYESVVRKIAESLQVSSERKEHEEDTLGYLISKLEAKSRKLSGLGISASDLQRWRICRNDVVHLRPIARDRAKDIVVGVTNLWNRYESWCGK